MNTSTLNIWKIGIYDTQDEQFELEADNSHTTSRALACAAVESLDGFSVASCGIIARLTPFCLKGSYVYIHTLRAEYIDNGMKSPITLR